MTPGTGDLIIPRRLIATDWMDFRNGWTCEFDELYSMIIVKFTSLLMKQTNYTMLRSDTVLHISVIRRVDSTEIQYQLNPPHLFCMKSMDHQ